MSQPRQAIVSIPRGGGCKSLASICSQLEYVDQDEDVVLELSERHGGATMSRAEYEEFVRLWAEQTGHFLNGESLYDGDQDLTTHIIVSFPPGTDREKAYAAGRTWAEEVFGSGRNGGEWDYVTGFHTNRPHPHLHVIVNRRSLAARGEWLAISHRNRFLNYDTLREALADAAYEYGIELDATSRAQRGLEGRGPTNAEYRRNAKVQFQEHFEDHYTVVDLAADGQKEVFPELTGVKPQSDVAPPDAGGTHGSVLLPDGMSGGPNPRIEEERASARADSRAQQERAMLNDDLHHRAAAGEQLQNEAEVARHRQEARTGVVDEDHVARLSSHRAPIASPDRDETGQEPGEGVVDYDAEAERQMLEETERGRSVGDHVVRDTLAPFGDRGESDIEMSHSEDEVPEGHERQPLRAADEIEQQLAFQAEQYRQRQIEASRRRRNFEDLKVGPERRKLPNAVPDNMDDHALDGVDHAGSSGTDRTEASIADADYESGDSMRNRRSRPKVRSSIETRGDAIRRRAAEKQARPRGKVLDGFTETRAHKRSRLKNSHDAGKAAIRHSMTTAGGEANNASTQQQLPEFSPVLREAPAAMQAPERPPANEARANGARKSGKAAQARTADRDRRNSR